MAVLHIARRSIWAFGLFLPLAVCGQWQSLNGGVNNEVRAFALAADGSKLLVSGNFPYVHQDSLRANNIAWWDGTSWSIEDLADGNGSTFPFGNPNPVFSLAIRSDTIFVGHLGDYWHGETTMGFAAMLAGGEWQPCGQPENWFFLQPANGRLFNGGRADTLYGQFMPMVNEWVNGAWQSVPGSPFNGAGTIYDATYWQGSYYFVGSFLAGAARSAVRFDGVDQWTPLADGIGGSFTEAVCGYGDSLYVGGLLPMGPNVVSAHVQIWDGSQWLPFFEEVHPLGKVRDIKEHNGALYIAGLFTLGSDTSLYGLLRYDGHEICALGGRMNQGGSKMAFFQDDLYMALPPLNDQLYYEFIGYLDLETVIPDACIVVSPTGVEENSPAHLDQFRLYPNPTIGNVTVAMEQLPNDALLVLRDALGRKVWQKRLSERYTTLDLAALDSGVYSMELLAGGKRMSAQRMVVQN